MLGFSGALYRRTSGHRSGDPRRDCDPYSDAHSAAVAIGRRPDGNAYSYGDPDTNAIINSNASTDGDAYTEGGVRQGH